MQEIVEKFLGLGVFLIPIIAIIVGGVIAIIGMLHKHQERLAKIERGMIRMVRGRSSGNEPGVNPERLESNPT